MTISRKPGTRLVLTGIASGTVPAGTTDHIFSWTADKLYYMDGASYEVDGHSFGDTIKFQVHHPVHGKVGEFTHSAGAYVHTSAFYDFYKATIQAGLIIKLIYTSVGAQDVKIVANLHLHVDDI